MDFKLLDNKAFAVLKNSLEISTVRHNMISSNIANVDTTGYKPQDIDFKKTLDAELNNKSGKLFQTNEKHYAQSSLSGYILTEENEDDMADKYHLDSVDIDKEMKNLSENNIKFRMSVEMLLRKISMLKQAIIEGGK